MRPSPLESTLFAVALAGLAWAALGPVDPPAFEPGPRRPDTYRVVTWNVGGLGPDGPTGFDDAAVEPLAAELNELQPDLVLLQEIGSREQLHRLRAALDGDWDMTIERDHERGRVAALGRGALIRLDVGSEPRRLGLVHASPLGTDVYVLGLHADAFDAQARNDEIGAAFDVLLALPRPIPRLLMGDLNLDLDLDKRRDLFSNDAYLDVETYNYVAATFVDAARGTGSTAEPDRRLDYVFCAPSFVVRAAGPWRGRRHGSMDHDPLVVDLALRADGPKR